MKSKFVLHTYDEEPREIVADGTLVGGTNGVLMFINEKPSADPQMPVQPDVFLMVNADSWRLVEKVGPYLEVVQ